jgi:hypothetical protein
MTDRISTTPERVDCERFDTLLPDYLEHELAPDARAEAESHLARCERCRALHDDLVALSRSAAALPPLQPARDLWAGIASRIEAPVVPLGRTGEQPVPTLRVERATVAPRQRGQFLRSPRWLAAAAGILVAVSVGSTYAVMRVAGRTGATTVAAVPNPAPNAVPNITRETTPAPETRQVAAVPETPERGEPAGGRRAIAQRRAAERVADMKDARRLASSAEGDVYAPAVRTYDREIAQLRAALRQRADLDSSTVAVLEKSLRLIDQAIAESRRALARDPRSRMLGDQLTRALDLKVEVLRTAVLLPSRS